MKMEIVTETKKTTHVILTTKVLINALKDACPDLFFDADLIEFYIDYNYGDRIDIDDSMPLHVTATATKNIIEEEE